MDIDHLTIQEGLEYFHPFSNECRVYGRLKEFNKEHIAIRCYGYLFLPPAQSQKLLANPIHDLKKDWGWKRSYNGREIHLPALVKEYIPNIVPYHITSGQTGTSTGTGSKSAGTGDIPNVRWHKVVVSNFADVKTGTQFLRNVIELHHMGIVVRDLHGSNVVDGRILDFSCAWTAPHPCFEPEWLDKNSDHIIFGWEERGLRDALDADQIVSEWNELRGSENRIWYRLTPNVDYCKKLRSHSERTVPKTAEERRAESIAFEKRYRDIGGRPELFKLLGRRPIKPGQTASRREKQCKLS